MFCKACGNELFGDETYCEACGAPVNERTPRAAGHSVAGGIHQNNDDSPVQPVSFTQGDGSYQSFEYARTTVNSDLAQATLDCYESLGYELTGQRKSGAGNQVALSFRRSRKVRNKAQLSKIQRTMDDTLASISNMEAEKTKKATSQAILIGIISALILGVGMTCTMEWTQFMVPGIIVGIIGI